MPTSKKIILGPLIVMAGLAVMGSRANPVLSLPGMIEPGRWSTVVQYAYDGERLLDHEREGCLNDDPVSQGPNKVADLAQLGAMTECSADNISLKGRTLHFDLACEAAPPAHGAMTLQISKEEIVLSGDIELGTIGDKTHILSVRSTSRFVEKSCSGIKDNKSWLEISAR